MEQEVINQILEMVKSAGEGAWPLALVYFLYPYFKVTVIFGAVLGVVWQICKTIRRQIDFDDKKWSYDHPIESQNER